MQDVPRLRKTEWPVHITDALGIPSVEGSAGSWHSTGDTTDLAWFHAMCDFLGLDYPGERIRAMRAIVEAAGGTWDQALHSSAVPGKKAGGNVRKEAFEELWRALHGSGNLTAEHRPSPEADALQHSAGGILPEPRWTYQQIRLRQGQPAFRQRLLTAYAGRCTISGTDISETLEAAHITSHARGGDMATSNGLLLRADLHTLFDLRLLAVDTETWSVLVHPRVAASEAAADLQGRPLHLPADPSDRPSHMALDEHRQMCGL
jgi:hypothetical protein